MQDAVAHCEWLVREADSDRFIATLYAPADRRPALHALYAFNAEIARVREAAREPLPGEMRLQWWREVLAGKRGEEARANPVAAALLDALGRHGVDADALIALIDARSFDLYDDAMASVADLDAYAGRTSSVLTGLAMKFLAADLSPAGESIAAHAGRALAIAGLLRAFPFHASERRIYLPQEILARHGVQVDEVRAGWDSGGLRAALADMRNLARDHLATLASLIVSMPREFAPAILPVALVRPLLKRMERRGYHPFVPVEVPQWRRQWLLWRAARNFDRIAG
jgi:phytoene synthase